MRGDEQSAFPAMPLNDYIDQFFSDLEQVGTDGGTGSSRLNACWCVIG